MGLRWRGLDPRTCRIVTTLTIAIVAEDVLAEMNVHLVGTPIAEEAGAAPRWIDRVAIKDVGRLHEGAFGTTRPVASAKKRRSQQFRHCFGEQVFSH